MREEAPDEVWHRRFAVDAFNASWELLDQPHLSEDEEADLLALVFASRWHWAAVGGDDQAWMGDHQIANALSRLGLSDLALRFVGRALRRVEANGWTGWRLASCHEGMARAHAAAGDAGARQHHLELARAALQAEPDPEDRAAIEAQLETVP